MGWSKLRFRHDWSRETVKLWMILRTWTNLNKTYYYQNLQILKNRKTCTLIHQSKKHSIQAFIYLDSYQLYKMTKRESAQLMQEEK